MYIFCLAVIAIGHPSEWMPHIPIQCLDTSQHLACADDARPQDAWHMVIFPKFRNVWHMAKYVWPLRCLTRGTIMRPLDCGMVMSDTLSWCGVAKARKWRKEGRNHLRKKIKGGNVKKEERERECVGEKGRARICESWIHYKWGWRFDNPCSKSRIYILFSFHFQVMASEAPPQGP